ncbi:Aldo-keto reductase family 1 member B1 [Taenia crassiceps]|uniref:Aldo-keto reductase family 1 member B1 n=1 Tax=Taenia crassiceps TaxID=6207 RepID=A0ABR4QAA6_9CEST
MNPSLLLNSGYRIPQLGFGTFDAPKEVVYKAVEVAIDAGYRHIDCAMFYENEKEVGAAIASSMRKHDLKREDIFLASKLWCDNHAPEDVCKACKQSVENFGLQLKEGASFDVNGPNSVTFEYHKLEDTWKAMEEMVAAGLVKSIGVSNFNKRQIECILASCTIPPAVNQVEVNIHCLNTKLIQFCHSRNILIEGYAPIGSPGFIHGKDKPLLQEENVIEIAHRHKKKPAQVLLRHGLQRDIVVLIKSVTPERIKSNFDVFDFELTSAEMEKLNKTGSRKRTFLFSSLEKHPEYPFHDEY